MPLPDGTRYSELNIAASQFMNSLNEDSGSLAHAAAAAAGEDSSEDEQPRALSRSSRRSYSKNRRPSSSMSERWVPYKQTNGVAVYYLDEPDSASPNGMGGEV